MKFLKTLAVIFALLALTVGTAAAEVTWEPFDAEEIEIKLPTGLAAQVKNCETKGEIEIAVNSDDTNWPAVITGVDGYGFISFGLIWGRPEGTSSCVKTTATATLSDPKNWSYQGVYSGGDYGYEACYNDLIEKTSPSQNCYAEGWIGEYVASTNTFVPAVYDKTEDGKCMFLLAVFFNEQQQPCLAKYATIRVTHTDASAKTVKLNYVPDERIGTDAGAEVTNGSVTYALENNHSIDKLVTTVNVPDGATSYVADGCDNEEGSADAPVIVTLDGIGKQDFMRSESVSIVWYDEDGYVLLAERLDIHVIVGTPKAWPNYITDADVTKGDVTFAVGTSAANASADFVKTEFDEASGTVNVSLDGAAPGGDLTQYNLYTVFEAPEGAVSCAHSTYEYIQFLGASTTAGRYESAENDLKGATKEPVVDGKFVYAQKLFESAEFSADQGLTVYYDFNATDENTGDVTMIDWFDVNGNRIERQWVARTFDPLSIVVTQPIITEPMSDELPQLIAEVPVSDYSLQVTSYPQNSESGTQIHYELKLVDADGNNVEFSNLSGAGTIQLLIPYPEGATAEDFTFTVNHYNEEGTSVQESVDTASATLEALDEGLLMTVKSLSPFVLSWEDPDGVASADSLPKTGDSSNLFLYALLCCVSLAGIMLLRRKSRA